MEMSYNNKEIELRKNELRNTYLASFFQHLLETVEFSLPRSLPAEQQQAFKNSLAERIANGKAAAERFVEEHTK
jgi:hypothetical protein